VWQMIDPTTGAIMTETFTGGLPADLVTKTGAGAKGGFTALQRSEEEGALAISEGVFRDIQRASKLLDEINVVGPATGSWAGHFFNRLKAIAGSEGAFNGQRTLIRLIASQTMENANKLKGPLTEKELGFLKASIPGLDDTEAVWKVWLGDLNAIYQRENLKRRAALDGRELTPQQLDASMPFPGAYQGNGSLARPANDAAAAEVSAQMDSEISSLISGGSPAPADSLSTTTPTALAD